MSAIEDQLERLRKTRNDATLTSASSREEARKLGIKYYTPSRLCVAGHESLRTTRGAHCVDCTRDFSRLRYRKDPEKQIERNRRDRIANPEKLKERDRAAYQKRREKNLAEKKAYFASNKERIKIYRDAYYEKNRETVCAKARVYRNANKEQTKASLRRWAEANKDRIAHLSRKRKARLRGAEGSHTRAETKEIWRLQGGKCAYCKAKLNAKAHLDHIKPISKGGTNYANNLQWLCEACNLSKGAKDPVVFAKAKGLLL